jgi:hypothetical protein
MPETKVTLYTDVISPFGYLAWHILNVRLILKRFMNIRIKATDAYQNSPVFANTNIILVPTFQGGIMQMNDNRPPFTVKSTSTHTCPVFTATCSATFH